MSKDGVTFCTGVQIYGISWAEYGTVGLLVLQPAIELIPHWIKEAFIEGRHSSQCIRIVNVTPVHAGSSGSEIKSVTCLSVTVLQSRSSCRR